VDNTTTLLDWFGATMQLMGGAPRVALKLLHTDGLYHARLGKYHGTGGDMFTALAECKRQLTEACGA